MTESPSGVPYFTGYRAGKWTRTRVPAAPGGTVDVTALALIPGTQSLWTSCIADLGFFTIKGAVIFKGSQ